MPQVLSGAQLFSAFVGEGEARLRGAFARARQAAPAILFIDEIDALGGRREADGGGGGAGTRLLSALLTEMDGLELATGECPCLCPSLLLPPLSPCSLHCARPLFIYFRTHFADHPLMEMGVALARRSSGHCS